MCSLISKTHKVIHCQCIVQQIMPPKATRKSVSFQANVGDTTDQLTNTFKAVVPRIKKSVMVLPFHLLLNLYGMFHFGLTADPFNSIVKGYVNLVVLQLVYGYLYATSFIEKAGKKKKVENDNAPLLVVSATVISIGLANVVFVILILFGAPLSSNLKESYALAYHLSLIIFQPLLIAYKLNYEQFFSLFKMDKIYRAVFTNPVLASSFFAVVGTWFGVLPIPLDWDRPWQQWPITLMCGGYLGAFFGAVVALLPIDQLT